MKPLTVLVATCLALLAFSPPDASGSEKLEAGEHTIYATALSSLLIPPEVAQLHGIVRSAQRIVINVTVLRDSQPATATVTGSGTNLLGQQKKLDFAEIREQTAIYYLASLITNEKDRVRFELDVLPDGASETSSLEFERSYYPTN